MLRELCLEHDFTVFAVEFENPNPERIEWVRIPAPMRPLALLFVVFHFLAPLYYLRYRWRHRTSFHLVQSVESNLLFGDVAYSQFCHRAYLRDRAPHHGFTARGIFRRLDHAMHAALEPLRYRTARHIVTPSKGLAAELAREFPFAQEKIRVVPNPVEVEKLRPPADFDRAGFRRQLGFCDTDVVLAFAALGQFERKGLPLLLDALGQREEKSLKLLVVGGEPDLIARYRRDMEARGLAGQVHFVGLQRDMAPYLWASDAFAFPSLYETFSLVTFEAAAAGLPLIVSRLYGVEDLLLPGRNGFEVETNVESISAALGRFLVMSPDDRAAMGHVSRERVQDYTLRHFVRHWRSAYAEWSTERLAPAPCGPAAASE